jgi:hypothetical protein
MEINHRVIEWPLFLNSDHPMTRSPDDLIASSYSEYRAVVVSVSKTVTSFTLTLPLVTLLKRELVSS